MNTERHLLNRASRALACAAVCMTLAAPVSAESLSGTYRGFLAFDFKGKEIHESMMITFHGDGTVIMGAEEGHDEPVDPATGLITSNDVESPNLGVWREADPDTLEFGSQQYRAGSGFCKPVNKNGKELLPTCSFILTARLKKDQQVRGTSCDLGGVGGGFSVQSVDGRTTEPNPFGLGLALDYCLQKMSVDGFFELAPIK